MRFKFDNRILIICIVLPAAILLFGYLIIFVTPQLFNLHPVTQTPAPQATTESSVILLSDTIKLAGDSLIVNTKKIENVVSTEQPQSPTIGDLGTFGDSAGFWNAIFSALAMLCVAVTLVYQLKKDRNDEERDRLARFQEQCLTMISMLSDIVSQLRIPTRPSGEFEITPTAILNSRWTPTNQGFPSQQKPEPPATESQDIIGRACFKYIYDERPNGRNIRDYITNYRVKADEYPPEEMYGSLKKVMESHFDHYFRIVYRILKFIKEADLGKADGVKQHEVRKLCADLIRAQLSTYEMAMLYYNGLNPRYRKTSKAIYEHHCIFDNLDVNLLIHKAEKDYYSKVRDNCGNPDEYDETVHYGFTAFTNKPKTVDAKADWKKRFSNWLADLGKSWSKRLRFGLAEGVESHPVLNDEETAVLDALNSFTSGKVKLTTVLTRTHLSEKVVLKMLKRLKDKNLIDYRLSAKHLHYTLRK